LVCRKKRKKRDVTGPPTKKEGTVGYVNGER